MSPTDEQPGGQAAFLEALRVRRNAARGLAVGALFTAAVFLVFVVLPPGTGRSLPYYLSLAVVLALTTGGLAAIVLIALRAHRLSQEL